MSQSDASFRVTYPVGEAALITVSRDVQTVLQFVLVDEFGRALDITGATVTLTVRTGFAGAVKLGPLVSTSHLDAVNGTVQFTITQAAIDTAASVAASMQSWLYEVRRTSSAVDTVHLKGEFRVLPAVTKG